MSIVGPGVSDPRETWLSFENFENIMIFFTF